MAKPPQKLIQTRSLADGGPAATGSVSLLVVGDLTSQLVPLPTHGSLVIGRAPTADFVLDDAAVSRHHARVIVRNDALFVRDEGSHNGTRVNGGTIDGERRLVLGDVIGIGTTSLVVQGAPRLAIGSLQTREALTARLEQEIARAASFERPIAVTVLVADQAGDLDGVARTLAARDAVAGWLEEGALALLLPEQDADDAAAELGPTLATAPTVRAGIATYPTDGADAATLLGAARQAAGENRPDGPAIAMARDARCALRVGEREIVVADAAMERIFALVRRLADSDLTVTVSGETGAGKENVAYAVHAWSGRSAGPFVTVNCAALQDNLIESELFGYRKGAFTGADADKPGLLEAAAGGTVFLDEVGELSPAAQAKLLRVLESSEITRLGDVEPRPTDVRVVAATNRDLEAMVASGEFRQDLFYRLAAAAIVVPALRQRRREIPVLARRFIAGEAARTGRPLRASDALLRRFSEYHWPGNVRELRNAVEFAAATSDGELLEPWHLPATMRDPDSEGADATAAAGGFRPIAEELQQLEKRRMQEALDAAGGVRAHAARLIGMPRRTFTLKLRKYGLQ